MAQDKDKYLGNLYKIANGDISDSAKLNKFKQDIASDPNLQKAFYNAFGEKLGVDESLFYESLKKKEQSVPTAPKSGNGSEVSQNIDAILQNSEAVKQANVPSSEPKDFIKPVEPPKEDQSQYQIQGLAPDLEKTVRTQNREYAENMFLTPEEKEDASILRSMIKSGVDPKNPTPRFQEILNERYAGIDQEIEALNKTKGNDEKWNASIDKNIQKLQKRKEFFFGTPEEKITNAIVATGNTPKEGDKYSQLTKIVEDKTFELRELYKEKENWYKEHPFVTALAGGLHGMGVIEDKKRDRMIQLQNELKDIVPLVLTAKDPELEEDDFSSSFMQSVKPDVMASSTRQEKAVNVANAVNQIGLKLDPKDAAIVNQVADSDIPFPATLGTAAGESVKMAAELAVGGEILEAAKVFKTSAEVLSKLKYGKQALEIARKSAVVKDALKSGVQYQTAGTIFQDENLDFTSGVAGGVGMGLFQKVSKPLLSMVPKDVKAGFLAEIGKKAANMTGSGIGEVVEESSQQLSQYIKEAIVDGSINKIGEYIHRDFKDLSDAGKFIASTFILGAAGGAAINPSEKVDFESLPENEIKILNDVAKEAIEAQELEELTSLDMEGFEGIYNSIKEAKDSGIITPESAEVLVNSAKTIATANERIPQDLDPKTKAKAQLLIIEKMGKEAETKGAEPALVKGKLQEIKDIDAQLELLVNPNAEIDQVVETNEMVKQPTTKEQYAGKTTAEVTQMAMNPSESTAQDTAQEQDVVAQTTPNILEEVKTLFPEDLNQEVTVDDYSKLSEKLTELGLDPNEYIPVNAKPQTFKEVEEAISDKIAFTDEIQSLENKLGETDLQDKSAFDGLIESLDNTIKKTTAFSQKYAGSNLGFITTPINGFLVVLRETLILARKLGKTYDEAKKLAYDRFTGKEEGFEADKEYLKLSDEDRAAFDKTISELKPTPPKDPEVYKRMIVRNIKKDKTPILNYIKKSLEGVRISGVQLQEISEGLDTIALNSKEDAEKDMASIDKYISEIKEKYKKERSEFIDRTKEQGIREYKKDRKPILDYVKKSLDKEKIAITPTQFSQIYAGIDSVVTGDEATFEQDMKGIDEYLSDIIAANKKSREDFNARLAERAGKEAINKLKKSRTLLLDYVESALKAGNTYVSPGQMKSIMRGIESAISDPSNDFTYDIVKFSEQLNKIIETNKAQNQQFIDNIRISAAIKAKKGLLNDQYEVTKLVSGFLKENGFSLSKKYFGKLVISLQGIDKDKQASLDKADQIMQDIYNDDQRAKLFENRSKLIKMINKGVVVSNIKTDYKKYVLDLSKMNTRDQSNEFVSKYNELVTKLLGTKTFDPKVIDALYNDVKDLQAQAKDPVIANFKDIKAVNAFIDNISARIEDVLGSEIKNYDDLKKYGRLNSENNYAKLAEKIGIAKEKLMELQQEGLISAEEVDDAYSRMDRVLEKLRSGIENVDYVQDEFEKRRFVEAKVLLNSLDRNLFTKEELESIKPLFEVQRGAIAKMNALEAEDFFLAAEQVANGAINKHVYDTAIVVGSMQNQLRIEDLLTKIKPKLQSEKARKWIEDLALTLQINNLQAFDSLLGTSKELDRPFVELTKRLLQNSARQEVETNRVLSEVYDSYNKLSRSNEVISKFAGGGGKMLYANGKRMKMFRTQVGMLLTQARYEANPVLTEDGMVDFKDLPQEMKDKFRFLYENKVTDKETADDSLKILGTSMAEYKEAWDSLIKDENGNVDLKANMDLLNGNKETKKFVESVRSAFANTVEKARVVAHSKGHDFNAEGDSYFAANTISDAARIKKDSFVEGNVFTMLTNNISPLLTTPGAAQAISRGVFFTDLDVLRVVTDHVQDVNQYYYISSPLKSILSSFKRNNAALEKEAIGSTPEERNDIEIKVKMNEMLAKRITERANMQYAKIAKKKDIVDYLAKGVRAYALANPVRLPSDFSANMVKALSEMNIETKEDLKNKIEALSNSISEYSTTDLKEDILALSESLPTSNTELKNKLKSLSQKVNYTISDGDKKINLRKELRDLSKSIPESNTDLKNKLNNLSIISNTELKKELKDLSKATSKAKMKKELRDLYEYLPETNTELKKKIKALSDPYNDAEYLNGDWSYVMEETGSSLVLKYDKNRETINSADQTKLEKTAQDMISWADVPTARFFYINAFRSNYKKLTGLDFDIEEYMLNQRNGSGFKYKEAIQKASDYATVATSEVMNSQDSFSQATHTRLIPFVNSSILSRDTKRAKSLNLMMSYGMNDTAQFMIKAGDLINDSNEGRAFAAKRLTGILASNATYGIMSNFFPSLIAAVIVSGDDDDDKNAFIAAAMETRSDMGGILLGNAIALGSGGYAWLLKDATPLVLWGTNAYFNNVIRDTKELVNAGRIEEEKGREIIAENTVRQNLLVSAGFEGFKAQPIDFNKGVFNGINSTLQILPLIAPHIRESLKAIKEGTDVYDKSEKLEAKEIQGDEISKKELNEYEMAKKELVWQTIFAFNMLSSIPLRTPIQATIKTAIAESKKNIPSKKIDSALMEYSKKKMTPEQIENFKSLLEKYKDTKVFTPGQLSKELRALRKMQSVFYKENELDQLFDASFLDE